MEGGTTNPTYHLHFTNRIVLLAGLFRPPGVEREPARRVESAQNCKKPTPPPGCWTIGGSSIFRQTGISQVPFFICPSATGSYTSAAKFALLGGSAPNE